MRFSILCAAMAILGAALPERGEAQTRGPDVRPTSGSWRPSAERQLICRGGAIPAGWILVDDTRHVDMCEGSNPAVVNRYNIWVIERYDNRPVGASIVVCASSRIPDGWVLVDLYRDKEMCGHPDDPFMPNVKRIRRAR